MKRVLFTILCWMVLVRDGGAVTAAVVPFLQVKDERYTNVVVTGASERRLFIRHTGGLATLRLENLTMDARRDLGLPVRLPETKRLAGGGNTGKPQPAPAEGAAVDPKQMANATLPDPTGPVATGLRWVFGQSWPEQYKAAMKLSAKLRAALEACLRSGVFWWVVGACGPLTYLIYCAALYKICEKSGLNGSMVVAIPVLRWQALLPAAGMPSGLFLIGLFAFAALVAPPALPAFPYSKAVSLALAMLLQVVWLIVLWIWSVRISRTLQRSAWLGVFVFLPVFHFFAVLVLARSRGKETVAAVPSARGIAFKVT